MLLVRNRYDQITFYMHEWSVPVKELAERKGIKVDCVDGPRAVKQEIISRIKKLKPDFVFLNGHGDNKTFYGYDDNPAIEISDASMLADRIVFARSCNCAQKLGKSAVEKHECKSFIGYEYEFFNVRQTEAEITPRQDNVSRPIWEVSNAVPISLVKGATVDEAVEASHKMATREISKLIFSTELGALEVLKAILANDDGLTYHGDGGARISHN